MSIAISVKVSEGLVLAADSASVVQGQTVDESTGTTQEGVVQVYSSATKITQVRDLPVGTITWGASHVGNRTIPSLVNEYANQLGEQESYELHEVATGLYEFLKPRYDKAFTDGKPGLGLQVAGYSSDEFFPDQYLLSFPEDAHPEGPVVKVRPDTPDGSPNFGANWYGMTDAIVRLYLGFTPQALEDLVESGVDPSVAKKLKGYEYPVVFEAMPLQDAIDFAAWLTEVAIGRARFVAGAAGVVGPVDIAIITRERGFEWVRQKTPKVSDRHPFVG